MTHLESFRTRDGVTLRLSHVAGGGRDAILVAPGIFMHRDSPEHLLLSARLAAHADVLTLDVRGHGDSGGTFSFGAREPQDVAEIAALLGVTTRTVQRDWARARAWLHQALEPNRGDPGGA